MYRSKNDASKSPLGDLGVTNQADGQRREIQWRHCDMNRNMKYEELI